MVNLSNYGDQDVKCPFYKKDEPKIIECEGIFSICSNHHFKSNKLKQEHKEKYCNEYNYKNCPHYILVLAEYKPYPKEMPRTFAEDTLLKYRQLK